MKYTLVFKGTAHELDINSLYRWAKNLDNEATLSSNTLSFQTKKDIDPARLHSIYFTAISAIKVDIPESEEGEIALEDIRLILNGSILKSLQFDFSSTRKGHALSITPRNNAISVEEQ